MWMTETDVKQLLHFASVSAAQKAGIPEIAWNNLHELHRAIRHAQPRLYAALEKFTQAYLAWFAFSLEIESTGKSGKLSIEENSKLMRLVSERDGSREQFIHELKDTSKAAQP